MFTKYSLRLSAAAVSVLLVFLLIPTSSSYASPGAPDRDRHPYVGVLVEDLGDGAVHPYCQITLISGTEAVTAHHCAPTGSEILFTLDNPILIPAQLLSGKVRMGGFDFGTQVDIAIIDLDVPVELPRYATIPTETKDYGPGVILEYVTYIAMKQSALVPLHGLPSTAHLPLAKFIQNEPAHVEYDRNLIVTTANQGQGGLDVGGESPLFVATMHPACGGNSGSPLLSRHTDELVGILSMGTYFCTGGGNVLFARTDNELAIGILTGTLPPPPPPPPPTEYAAMTTGLGATGTSSFWAMIGEGSEYTGLVTGLSPATKSAAAVAQDEVAVFPVSLNPGFHSYTAVLLDQYTSGNDDLDLYAVGYMNGEPILLGVSVGWTSQEGVIVDYYSVWELDDPNSIEIWVHGWFTEGPLSSFTLFASETGDGSGQGDPVVSPVTAGPTDPYVSVELSWSGLDPLNNVYVGWIQHFNNGIPQEFWKHTIVAIDIPQ